MKTTAYIMSCFLSLAVSLQAATVLCVGINEYANYPNLNHAENDASEMARIFTEQGHEVILVTGSDVTVDTFKTALEQAPEFIYYAGHGEDGRLMLTDGDLALAEIATAETMMLLDCCYVGRGLKDTGTMKILAAAEYEAFEADGHGLFTKYLMDWMNDGNNLSEENLHSYLRKNIGAETGGWQRPVLGYI